MPQPPDPAEFAASVLPLIQRFMGNQPDALAQMRVQIENELAAGREMVARAEAQLAAIEQLQALIDTEAADEPITFAPVTTLPLKKAILRLLDERPEGFWHRDELLAELNRRGWGPGGTNPRNTFTSRLRDLEKEKRLRRVGRDSFTSLKNEGAIAM
jgi:hypothetical protein